jgi:hypothetical protein
MRRRRMRRKLLSCWSWAVERRRGRRKWGE